MSNPSTSEVLVGGEEVAPTGPVPLSGPRVVSKEPHVAANRAAGPAGLSAGRAATLRKMAVLRRKYGALVLLVPVALVVAADFAVRGHRLLDMPGRYFGSYVLAVVESALFWGLLLFVAARRRGALRHVATGLLVVLAMCAMGTQVYFHTAYATYLNLDATLFGTSVSSSVFGQLRADGANVLTKLLPPFLFAAAAVFLTRRVVRPRRRRRSSALRIVAPAVVVAVFLIPCSYRKVQASTPDVIYFHAMGGLAKQLLGLGGNAPNYARPGLRTPPQLPAMTPQQTAGSLPKKPARNVIFVLTESVRFDVSCPAHVADCPTTPETNAAVPDRIPFTQLRSNSSTTAIELAVLWSGLEPTNSRAALHSAPLLFDFGHAAGIDDAYWTSHHMMFANSRLWVQDLPTSHRVGATDLDPLADIDLGANDKFVAERAEKDLLELKEPFFAVIHFGNTHVPYLVDKEHSPFQPSEETKDEGKNEAYRNYYKNAVYLQDKHIGSVLRFIKSAPFADRTVILYTSDHGEAFREHGQLGHTGAVLDEEIHVPGWIDAPPGTLTDTERASLQKASTSLAFHTDFTPTMLDLMGLWDDPKVAPYRAKMPGSSLLRPFGPEREQMTLGLTNCSGIWGCAYKNWGVMRGSRKLEGREWYTGWHCFDVLQDPQEKNDLGQAGCGDLMEYANKVYGEPPSGK